jgi:hypothetical protein
MSCTLGSFIMWRLLALAIMLAIPLAAVADSTIQGSTRYATPDFRVTGNRVMLGAATQSYALPVDKPPYNAVCDGVTDDSSAFSLWFADIIATARPGVLPPRSCRISSQVYWNIGAAAASGVTIVGSGLQKSRLLLTTTSAPAMRIGGSAGTYSFINMSGFAIQCALPAACVEFGHSDYSDIISAAQLDLYINNADGTASAVAARFNDYRSSPHTSLIASTGGAGIVLDCRQCAYNTWFGTYSSASIGIQFRDGNSFGNTFLAVDIESITGGASGGPVVSTTANASRNTWIGGNASWTNSSATGGGVRASAGGGFFEFRGMRWVLSDAASILPLAIGTAASIVMDSTNAIGAYGFDTVSIANQLNLTGFSTPATSSDPCTRGLIKADANFLYLCTATNTWKRTALTGGF